MVPVLLKPKLLGARNRLRHEPTIKGELIRDGIVIVFGIALMIGIYDGAIWSLARLKELANLVYLPSSHPLGLIFMMLFVMLLISNAATAIGTLFLGHDLELVLAAPVNTRRLFWGKIIEIAVSTSWMPFAFIGPLLLGFGVSYDAPMEYYVLSILILIPYFLIPTAIAVIGCVILTSIVPANHARKVLLALLLMFPAFIYLLVQIVARNVHSENNFNEVLRIISVLSMPNANWLPANWVAKCFRELLEPTGAGALPYLGILYTSAAALLALSYLMLSLFHHYAFSRAQDRRQGLRIDARASRARTLLWNPLQSQRRAMVGKEARVCLREMTQVVQVLMLIGLCIIYLYNLRIFGSAEDLPIDQRVWWHNFLFVCNVAMGAFVTTAICTRLVFTSVSLEGQAFWILLTAPLTVKDILKCKFYFWLVPVALLSSIVYASGSFVIGVRGVALLGSVMSSFLISYGIVGLAVGLGAYFAFFQWEHPSQLAASMGSLIFMLVSTLLIFINMIPTGVLLFRQPFPIFGRGHPDLNWYAFAALLTAFSFCLNVLTAYWCLNFGAHALERRME